MSLLSRGALPGLRRGTAREGRPQSVFRKRQCVRARGTLGAGTGTHHTRGKHGGRWCTAATAAAETTAPVVVSVCRSPPRWHAAGAESLAVCLVLSQRAVVPEGRSLVAVLCLGSGPHCLMRRLARGQPRQAVLGVCAPSASAAASFLCASRLGQLNPNPNPNSQGTPSPGLPKHVAPVSTAYRAFRPPTTAAGDGGHPC